MSRRSILAAVASLGGAAWAAGEVRVKLETALGPIELALDTARAPLSSGDFLKYVDRNLFEGAAFYRTVRPDDDINPVRIDVIQGGLLDDKKMLPPIAHEPTNKTGLRHRDGTISIARGAPGTGSAGAFFISIGDQPALDFGGKRNPDGQGFAAFGQVVHGMDVVRRIWRSKIDAEAAGMAHEMLKPPIPIRGAHRL
ncbi:MAG TPA: peptidylprolyl isomerase [Caulobacteraceae bacterium]|nr:peptidylprolyl isomerase [Caulobacteraceae bacterium]